MLLTEDIICKEILSGYGHKMCFGQQPFVGLRHLNVLVATEVAPYRHRPKTTSKMMSFITNVSTADCEVSYPEIS